MFLLRNKKNHHSAHLNRISKVIFGHFQLKICDKVFCDSEQAKVSIGGRTITNLQFANDIDAFAEEEQKIEAQVKLSTRPAQGIKWR